MARNETEGIQWLRSNHPFFYIRKASPCLCRHARTSFFFLKHKSKPEKTERKSDGNIQPQEWDEGSKEAILIAIKRGVENDPLVCFDYGLPRPGLNLHPYYTRKWPGKRRDDRIHSPSPRAALKANVCRKAVSWALKWEVMHDPWVVFDHG
ncbi:Uncharacterized protein Rs2_50176 [Raphanus sativus]|nr:Uncharacterized protein Rs2_50176 [Raphanus sativus]